jgi:uncharacterized protein YciU (UPF0263 family)
VGEVEDSVKWRAFEKNFAEVRAGFADQTDDEIEAVVEAAVTATRRARSPGAT